MLPDSQGALMGDQAFVNVKQKLPLENDRGANAYVECVAEANEREVGGQREVAVFQQNSLNAFALPDGEIGVAYRHGQNPRQSASTRGGSGGRRGARAGVAYE